MATPAGTRRRIRRGCFGVAVVIWIGGVGFVTMIVLPILRARREPGESMTVFPAVEERRAEVAAEANFARLARLHWVLLAASLVTVFGAVAGSHGVFF
ncbi:MAG TPA: hypothetical protein VJO12_14030 [Stellaceae bacterium]|nr:hypothetical protein [Stellaceae bacterium]